MPKVAITHQGFIPDYRVRFFELLNEQTDSEYVIFHGRPPSGSGHYAAEGPFAFPNVFVDNQELRLLGKSLIYQPVLSQILRSDYDAVVMGSHLQFVSNHLLFAACKLKRRPVLYWGHGDEKGAGVRLKYLLSRLPDGYLAYTEAGAGRLLANGVSPERVTVVRNTLDMEGQIGMCEALRSVDEQVLRSELGLRADSVVLVYLGRIYPTKRVVDLIHATRVLTSERETAEPFEVVIIGDGPSAAEVREAAAGLTNVAFTGELRDQQAVARYLRVAAAVVMPGVMGLTVNHALAHGVPLIHQTIDIHSPEMEYLSPGQDSLLVDGFPAFVDALADVIASPELRQHLAQTALEARKHISLDAMVSAFDSGVCNALERKPRGGPQSI